MVTSRKGSILDLPLIAVAVFMIAIVVLLSNVIITEFKNETADYTSPSGNVINQTILEKGEIALSTFDYAMILITIGLGLATIIFGFYIKTHPVMFAFSLILLIFFVIITSFFTNAFMEFVSVDPLDTQIDNFPFMYTLFENLPLIMTVIGIITAIAMYAKSGGADIGI